MLSRSFTPPRSVGFAAGLFACVLVVFGVAGILWGLCRPRVALAELPEGGFGVDMGSAPAVALLSFTVITGGAGTVTGVLAFTRGARFRGLGTLLWVGVCALAGAAAFVVFSGLFVPTEPAEMVDGAEFVPPFPLGVALLAAPFMAMFGYWSATFVSGDEAWETQQIQQTQPTQEAPTAAPVTAGDNHPA